MVSNNYPGVVDTAITEALNVEVQTIPAGAIVTPFGAGVTRTHGTPDAIGIVPVAIPSNTVGDIQVDGTLSLSDWTNAVGTSNLVTNQVYYRDQNNWGRMTTTVPTTGVLQIIGTALNPTTLVLEFQPGILL